MLGFKTMRKLVILFIVLLFFGLTILFAALYFFQNIDEIVRSKTESVLTEMLGVEVTLVEADVRPTESKVLLRGLVISNPAEFESEYAMSFDVIEVEADIPSLRTNEPNLRLIRIERPHILYERELKASNLGVIQDNLAEKSKDESGKQWKIDNLILESPKVEAVIPLSNNKKIGIETATINFEDLSGAQERISTAEGLQQTWNAVMLSIAKSNVADFSIDVTRDNDIREGVKNRLRDLLNEQVDKYSNSQSEEDN